MLLLFGKVGRVASEEVLLHLVTTKCIPVLLYGLEGLKSVLLPGPNCTHLTLLLLVSWWSCLIHLVLLL